MDAPAPRAIAVAVVVDGGRVLVGRRESDAADAAGCDEFPGGLVEPGETAAEAAGRECLEETGIGIVVGERLDCALAPSSRGAVEIHFFRCRPRDPGPPRAPFAWRPVASLDPGAFPGPNQQVISALLAEHAPQRNAPEARQSALQGGS